MEIFILFLLLLFGFAVVSIGLLCKPAIEFLEDNKIFIKDYDTHQPFYIIDNVKKTLLKDDVVNRNNGVWVVKAIRFLIVFLVSDLGLITILILLMKNVL